MLADEGTNLVAGPSDPSDPSDDFPISVNNGRALTRIPCPFKEGHFIEVCLPLQKLELNVREYEEYSVNNARSFFLEYMAPRLSIWLDQCETAHLPRRILVHSLAYFFTSLRKAINMFIGFMAQQHEKVKERLYYEYVNWLLTQHSKQKYQCLLFRCFNYSLTCFLSAHDVYDNHSRGFTAGVNLSKYLNVDPEKMFQETLPLLYAVLGDRAEWLLVLLRPFAESLRAQGREVMRCLASDVTLEGVLVHLDKKFGVFREWVEQLPYRMEDASWGEFKSFMDRELIDNYICMVYEMTIVKVPESWGCIDALRALMLKNTGYGRERLIATLNEHIRLKLLQVGVTTNKILSCYANVVEALRILDPTCFILHRVGSLMKTYLKKRSDTVRQIISYITMERHEGISEQIMQRKATIVDEEQAIGVNDEFLPSVSNSVSVPWNEWMPDPPDALAGESTRFQRHSDVFSMLISVYGNKESFVKEYRQLLAERLTQSVGKDLTFELRYLELLKQRFSEGELQQCEVMLKDVRDSERSDQELSTRVKVPISARVISSHFWPKMDTDTVSSFPKLVEDGLKAYAQEYKSFKYMKRCLNWIRPAGCVDITVSIDGVDVQKVVSHTNAAMLYLFLDKEKWSVADAAEELKISKGVALKRLEWWQAQGVLVQSADGWTLTSQAGNLERFKAGQEAEEEDSDVGEAADSGDAVEELEQYWNYTKNFISNHEQKEVKAERLFTLYKMFGTNAPLTLEHVNTFLQRKVRAGLLQFNNGFFRISREPPQQQA